MASIFSFASDNWFHKLECAADTKVVLALTFSVNIIEEHTEQIKCKDRSVQDSALPLVPLASMSIQVV